MKIKLVKSWGLLDAGEILIVGAGVGEQLVQRGRAIELRDEKRGGPNDTNKVFLKPPKPKK